MSKTTRLADFFFKKRLTANYITRSFHGNQHGPPWYLSHGDLPHTLKAGNQHGSQHGTQHGPPRYLSHGDLPHFVFLLLLVALSISFLVCWCLLMFVILSCRLLFLSSLSGFLPVAAYFGRLCDEHGTQHISKNKSRPFLGDVLVSVLSPPQTWNLNSY